MLIPVEVQEPNKPHSAVTIGSASEDLTLDQVCEQFSIKVEQVYDGKIISGKMSKTGDKPKKRWSLVTWLRPNNSAGMKTCPHCGKPI